MHAFAPSSVSSQENEGGISLCICDFCEALARIFTCCPRLPCKEQGHVCVVYFLEAMAPDSYFSSCAQGANRMRGRLGSMGNMSSFERVSQPGVNVCENTQNCSSYLLIHTHTHTFIFTFSHLADAFVQSHIQGREQSSYTKKPGVTINTTLHEN